MPQARLGAGESAGGGAWGVARRQGGGDGGLEGGLGMASETPTTKAAVYRVRFIIDEDAQFEECNGEARPLTEAEYARDGPFRGCPDHPRAGTRVITFGVNPDGSGQVQGCAICSRTDYQDISYQEYLAYYGNPERHVYVQSEVQQGCPCCGAWKTVVSTGRVDLMDDADELRAVGTHLWFEEGEIEKIPGYLREVAREDLDEAKRATASATRP